MSADTITVDKAPRLAPSLDSIINASSSASIFENEQFNIGVATDGSLSAKAALKFASEYLLVRKATNTSLDVIHVFDTSAQGNLDRPYKKDTIQAELQPLGEFCLDSLKLRKII